jgi:RHS repeat-associated protein
MNLASSVGNRGGSLYLGKDILGSVRSSSGEYGTLEERYEYDAFGKPYKGDLSNGMNLGHTGKPYDATTGLYNCGYRDYKPEAARFTTLDPVRDGSNWFAYVNNDPVNWKDPWGLSASDNPSPTTTSIVNTVTSIVNTAISWAEKPTGEPLTKEEATFQQVVGYGAMAVGGAAIVATGGQYVSAGLFIMSAGAMVVVDAIYEKKSDPLTVFAGVSNPVVGNDDIIFVAPLP